jgi:hypothetical protein
MPLSLAELRTAVSFLRQAKVLVEGVKDLFFGRDTDAAARMGDICQRIDDEHGYIGRLIAKASPNEGANG